MRLQSLEAVNNLNTIRGGGTSGLGNCNTSNQYGYYTRLQYRERHYALPNPTWGGGKISSHTTDYRNVPIPTDSVIYCDIPYQDTNRYQKCGFDYESFYHWCSQQTEPVFISSYSMPEDKFVCVAEFSHRSTLSASANNAVKERVFVPVHQA